MRPFFYTLIAGFFTGVFVRSEFEVSLVVVGAGMGAALMLTGLYTATQRRPFLLLALACVATVSGAVRTELALPVPDAQFDAQLGTKVAYEGVVVREPDVRENRTLLTVAVEARENTREVRMLVHAPRRTPVRFGDTVRVLGTLKRPEPFTTDAGTFNYPRYLAKDGILYEVPFAKVEVLCEGRGMRRALIEGKHIFLRALYRTVSEPESALASGLLVGAKRSLGEKITEEFRVVGLTHVVVLSGFNLTIIATAVLLLMRAFPQRVGFTVGAGAIVAFTLMAGAGAAAVRAAIMALLALLARSLVRPVEVLHLLLVASFLMVMWNPLILLSDPGFQLSVIATAGLVTLSPWFERRLAWIPASFGARAIVAATLATQCAVAPLLLSLTGELSLVALLANLLALPVIPLAMLVSFLAGCAGLISGTLASPFGLFSHAILAYLLGVAHVLAQAPFASLTVPPPPPLLVCGIYLVAISVYVRWRTSASRE